MAEFDDLKAYTNLKAMQDLTELNNLISGFYIKVDSIKNIRPLTKKLSAELRFPFYVRSFYKTHQHIFTWLDLQKKPVPLILGLIILVAAFNIIGTMLMNVIQQTRKIGVLRVLGLRAKDIRSIFILQGMILALTGIILGNIFALTLGWAQTEFNIVTLPASIYFISEVPIYFDLSIYLLVSAAALAISLLVSFIPSRIASRISPLSAVRFE
jgi:lipoprotein-releasing system permease protein